jgi:cytochrome c biogenesis protein CcmG, thiol:disulfide interchange protein DsbE
MATQSRGNDQTRTLLLIAAVVGVIAVLGVVIALVVGGDGGDDDDDSGANMYRPVAVEGEALAPFSEEIRRGDVDDPAVGEAVPVVSGVDYVGNEITIDPANDGPTMVVLLAHWCPHCNDEIPVLNEWRDSGEIPDDLDIVGVSTGVSSDAPNYPPDEWLVEKDWQWPVLADDRPPDENSPPPAMGAYGGTSYPTMVLIDGDGRVNQRLSGEVPIDVLAPLVDDLVAEAVSG